MTAAVANSQQQQMHEDSSSFSSRFLSLDEKWGTTHQLQNTTTNPTTCQSSDFPSLPCPSMTPLASCSMNKSSRRMSCPEQWARHLSHAPIICGDYLDATPSTQERRRCPGSVTKRFVDLALEEAKQQIEIDDDAGSSDSISSEEYSVNLAPMDSTATLGQHIDYGYDRTVPRSTKNYEEALTPADTEGTPSYTRTGSSCVYDGSYINYNESNTSYCDYLEPVEQQHQQEQQQPDYGYGEASPDVVDYGYGEAAPDVAYKNKNGFAYSYQLDDTSPPSCGNGRRRSGIRNSPHSSVSSDRMISALCESSCSYNTSFNSGNNSPIPTTTTTTTSKKERKAPRRSSSCPDASPIGRRRRERRGAGGSGISTTTVPRRSSMTAAAATAAAPRRSSMKHPGQPRRASIHLGTEREVVLPITGERVKRRSSITFDEVVILQPVAAVSELTKNPEALWFQDKDVTERRVKSQRFVKAVESGCAADRGMKPCLRGLEGFMGQHVLEKASLRYDGWDAVLDEQFLQIHKCTFDEEAISNVYQPASLKGQELATLRAKQDEKDVESYLRSTRRMCRRLSC